MNKRSLDKKKNKRLKANKSTFNIKNSVSSDNLKLILGPIKNGFNENINKE